MCCPGESSNCTCFSMLLCLTQESDEQTSKPLIHSQPVTACDCASVGHDEPSGNKTPNQLCMSELTDHGKNLKFYVETKLPINKARSDFVPCS